MAFPFSWCYNLLVLLARVGETKWRAKEVRPAGVVCLLITHIRLIKGVCQMVGVGGRMVVQP